MHEVFEQLAPQDSLIPGGSSGSTLRRPRSFESLRSLVEGDLLPRLLLLHRARPVPPGLAARAARVLPGGEYDRFLELILGGHRDHAVAEFLDDLLHRGHSPESVFADLLAPAARRLGELWEEDICDFTEVTLACCQMQRVIRRLGRTVGLGRIPGTKGGVLVMTLPEEQHTLGAVVVAEILGRNGWSISLGRPFNVEHPDGDFVLLAFSLARVDQWEAARDLISAVRGRHEGIQVMVGGSAFLTEPGLVSRVGADGWAEDGKALTALADRLCGT